MIKLIWVYITCCLAVAGQLSVAECRPVLSLLSQIHLGATQQGVGTRERTLCGSEFTVTALARQLSHHSLRTKSGTPQYLPLPYLQPGFHPSFHFVDLMFASPTGIYFPWKVGPLYFLDLGCGNVRLETVNTVLSKRRKLGVPQINIKEWKWREERSCVEQLFFGDRFHTSWKSTLTPLNAQNVGHRSFGNSDLSDFMSVCLPTPLRISMKKMSSF